VSTEIIKIDEFEKCNQTGIASSERKKQRRKKKKEEERRRVSKEFILPESNQGPA
jgi:hypothetical protein